ncbi:protein SGT1 homolog [Lepisosteus oculatus]|uniref:protein SGT1 homolog n=1 Tax=Lepisosteus oculatus TaxID=7918 RepID=UPI00073FCF9E|nr:PREDICTED: protein SGT1 homolog [Lepisosteus oculatus]
MADERSFPDSLIDEDPQKALEELNGVLERTSDNAEWYCQRSYTHLLLQNYSSALEDAKKALDLKPNLALAYLRAGAAEYHLKNYESSYEAFKSGQKLDESDSTFGIWIKRCEENMDLNKQNGSSNTAAQPNVKYDWYQTEPQVIITIMVKNSRKEDVNIQFEEKMLHATVKLPQGDEFNLKKHLLHSIVPEQSTFKILSSKIEIKMRKTEAIRWEQLEGEGAKPNVKQFTPSQYPSSSHYTKNWDKLVVDIKEEEKSEKLEGDAALNKLFQQIYADGSDEVKRAMNKSFMESGGTVLSTNWSDVSKRKVDVSPPDDAEWKKF